jgi:hypothetical protein
MRALTVRQPWADAIAHGPKRVENRTRPTKYQGRLPIHAGLAADRSALHGGLQDDWPDTRGAVIATAYLTGCHEAQPEGCCGAWSFPDSWHWLLALVRPLAEPVPAKGQLGLWTPDSEVLAAVEAQLTMEAA